MPTSMTGYGAAEAAGPEGRFRAEVRGVNGRFLDVRMRLPTILASTEADLRRRLGESFKRGRIDLFVSWEPSEDAAPPIRIHFVAARAYLEASIRLRDQLGVTGEMGIRDLLALPGVVETTRADETSREIVELAMRAVEGAIEAMDRMRRSEGASTAEDLRARLDRLAELREKVLSRAGTLPEAAKRRLEERLARLGVDASVDPSRLAQEVAYLADRSDVAEELARLETHIGRARETLRSNGGPVGKTLEFLAQELLRETNTIGSKMADTEISSWVIEMKTEIERLREQVQNLE